jgi:membrane-bound lytic murein transglycosylase D
VKTTIRAILVGAGAIFAAGCASVSEGPKASSAAGGDTWTASAPAGQEHYQFAPLPPAEIISQDLGPRSDRPTSESLAEAEAEFLAAAEARERGDEAAAYQHYTEMMERLLDANIDPATFYRMREQFADTPGAPSAQPEAPAGPALDRQLEASAPVNARVQAEIEAIQRVYPKSFQAGLDRSYRYLPYVHQKFAEAGLPEDLMWLAMVESQFTPKINSHAGAGGMWQFMRGTGRRYGLRTDWYVDDRYDWRKATDAAIDYLSELYGIFDGNWPLAITAYNMGEGGLARAIDSAGGEDDLWRLIETRSTSRRIAMETKRYYAKLLATIIVAKNPEQYGFERRPQPAEDAQPLKVRGFYSLAEIEKKAGIERGALAALNPQLLRGYTPPARETVLAVPAAHNGRVATVLASMPEMRPGTHVVRPGETLGKIASIYRVPVSELQSANSISSPKNLRAGQQLVIPGGVTLGDEDAVVTASAPARSYTVRTGDSLSEIADRHRVSVKDLQRWNRLGASTEIRAGQRLMVTAAEPAAAPVRERVASAPVAQSEAASTHVVRRGETASLIAKKHGVAVGDLLAWNDLTSRSVLHIGDTLVVQNPAVRTAAAPAATVMHVAATTAGGPVRQIHSVATGEGVGEIAGQYDVSVETLYEWNGWKEAPMLGAGDEVVVFQPAPSQD